jgi:hypothetical protein
VVPQQQLEAGLASLTREEAKEGRPRVPVRTPPSVRAFKETEVAM